MDSVNGMSLSEYYIDFLRKRITELRLVKGVSEHAMSLALGKDGSYIRKVTQKAGAVPTLVSFLDICDYFGITPSEFFDGANRDPAAVKAVGRELTKYNSATLNRCLKLLENTPPELLDSLLEVVFKVTDED